MALETLDVTPAQIWRAARAMRASYHGAQEEISPYLTPLGLSGQVQTFAQADSEGFVYHDDAQAILAFRGSQTLGDWLYNANVELVAWDGPGRVHHGFLAALDACWSGIAEAAQQLAGQKPLLLTGHSLGGAMAMLAADRLHRLGAPAAAVVTFGSPKVGDEVFAAAYGENYAGRSVSLLNQGDPVPWLPVLNSEFALAGESFQFSHSGDLNPRPPQWQAMLMLVGGVLSGENKENLLEFRPHSKDEYLRLAEEHFGQA
jgi:predicted lipase